jgi:hemerythrin-like domain-containing protein
MNEGARRTFLIQTASAGLLVAGCGGGPGGVKSPVGEHEQGGVGPLEDLMREHGVLNRLLLAYDESARRLEARQAIDVNVVAKSADIIRRFIEDYHEKLEEDFIFPRFEKAGFHVDLVATLRRQHRAGRSLTDGVLELAKARTVEQEANRRRLVETLRSFVRMYRPHEAREDTVLFRAFREVVTQEEVSYLAEQFENQERARFGRDGFENIVVQLGEIERALGIFDLNEFTPK